MAGQGVTLYGLTAAGNKAIVGTIDWRENIYLPSQINDNVAQIMADIRTMAVAIADGWLEVGDGDGVYTATYVSATSFQFTGLDVTPLYRAGMRVRVVAPTPGTISGTITSAAFSANTTITVAWDSGSLSNEAITAVKIGIGSGDTSSAATGTRHDCRFDFVNGTTCRLNRYGGSQITIDGQLRTIPAAGVDLTYNVSWGPANSVLYVYAKWTSGAMSLAVGGTPAVDARDGNIVAGGDPTATLVGLFVVSYASSNIFTLNATVNGVASYWNRRRRTISVAWNAVVSSSTSLVELVAGRLYCVDWGEDAIITNAPGYAQGSIQYLRLAFDLRLDDASGGMYVQSDAPVATGMVSQSVSGQFAAAPGFHKISPYVAINVAGTGTWSGAQFLSSGY